MHTYSKCSDSEFHPGPLLVFLVGDSYICPDRFLWNITSLLHISTFSPSQAPRAFTTASVLITSSANRLGHTSLQPLLRHSVTWSPQGIRELLGLMSTIQIQVQESIYMKEIGAHCSRVQSRHTEFVPQVSTCR